MEAFILSIDLSTVWKEVGSILGLLMAGFLGYFVPKISNKIKTAIKQRLFDQSLKKSVDLKVKLAELKVKLKATRIYLYQFHNGTVFLGGHDFHKYSVSAVFEIVSQGLSREIQNMQSVPLSKYAELLNYFLDKKAEMLVVGNFKDTDMTFEDADLEEIKYTINPTSVVFIQVKDKAGAFIGLIAIHFDREIVKDKFLDNLDHDQDFNKLLIDIKNTI